MPIDLISDLLYDDLNKQVGFGQSSPLPSNSIEGIKLLLLIVFLNIPLVTEKWIESINSAEYPFNTLPYKEYSIMTDWCRAINRWISACQNGAFHFIYSMKQGEIYVISPIDNEKVFFNDSLWDILGYKQNIINGRSAGTISRMDNVIFAVYPPGFLSDIVYFFVHLLSRHWESVIPRFLSYVFWEEKPPMNTFVTTIWSTVNIFQSTLRICYSNWVILWK